MSEDRLAKRRPARQYTYMETPSHSEMHHKEYAEVAVSKHSVTRGQICRRLTFAVVGTVLALTPVACGHQQAQAPTATPASHARPNPTALSGSGTFTSPDPASKAITYNPSLAPVDAAILTSVTPGGYDYSSTVATVVVAGLLPNRSYAVHAHTNACGLTGEDAGPHYQNRLDPAAKPSAPSTNPQYANPRNEIWLDIRTDATGEGTSQTTVPFGFTDRRPGSIVLHEAMTTATTPGQAGKAGARIACVTLFPSATAPREPAASQGQASQ
jgi:superoxide dismutase, Cu-Zn family